MCIRDRLTSVEADELIEISNGTNLTLKMVDGAVLSGRDQTETYDEMCIRDRFWTAPLG